MVLALPPARKCYVHSPRRDRILPYILPSTACRPSNAHFTTLLGFLPACGVPLLRTIRWKSIKSAMVIICLVLREQLCYESIISICGHQARSLVSISMRCTFTINVNSHMIRRTSRLKYLTMSKSCRSAILYALQRVDGKPCLPPSSAP